MLVRMLEHIPGARDGKQWPPRGGIIELPEQEALALIANAYAQPIPPVESSAFGSRNNGEASDWSDGIEVATVVKTRNSVERRGI